MQLAMHMVTIEDLMPQSHFLRKLETALDLSFVYEETDHLYSKRFGRPPIDPVVVVKYLLVGFLYGIPSERQIEQRIQTDIALRWYLGLDLFDRVPDHSTISQLRRRKPSFRKVFRRPHKRVSQTDPESGHLNRPGKPRGPHYLVHQVTDHQHGVILAAAVTSGDVNDSIPFLGLLEHVHKNVIQIKTATADAAYDFPMAHRYLGDMKIDFFVRPQPFHDRTNAELKRDAFRYDEQLDAYVCPQGKFMRRNTLHRSASGLYWLYLAKKQDCHGCPLREKCRNKTDKRGARKLEHSYFREARLKNINRQHEPEYREALKLRQIWCEGTFAARKRDHNLMRVLRRGLEAAEDHCLLSATALNLKWMIKYTK